MPKWLEKAVFYQIYPQSFYDTNADGIGDIQGIIEKLDYVKDLGCNAIWINPCFESAFEDAGYDVTDYYKIASRYGTNADLKRLFEAARARDIKVILDLVAGHTSIKHPWFKESMKSAENEYTNRYIWTSKDKDVKKLDKEAASKFEYAEGALRAGKYMYNFYPIQPALNYGFANPEYPWQLSVDHPDCRKTVEELKNIMKFWLDMGADGFRVDMAYSLVKNDTEDKTYTKKIWQNIRKMLNEEYPEAVMISEWFNPAQAIDAGFHADFYVQCNEGYKKLFIKEKGNKPFFSSEGEGDCSFFAEEYTEYYEYVRARGGYMSTPTGNHDTVRFSHTRTIEEMKIALAFVMALPGIPMIYYGDEIGMRYLNLPSKEGGKYRTGSRTPMQWSKEKNAGFSEAEASKLYLPIDKKHDRPTVANQEEDASSLLNFTRRIISLRKINPALANNSEFKILYAKENEYPLIFERFCQQQRVVAMFNPSNKKCSARLGFDIGNNVIFHQGDFDIVSDSNNSLIKMSPQSFVFISY
ncbi:MAG: glycosylase [Clostridiales bacterium]|nr:glycosylase [Clostridiales bacterium]